jgi:hypothetical protein
MVLVISVKPLEAGWAVSAKGLDDQMVFTSGAKAETAARQWAGRIAATGEPAEIEIWLRDGALGGRFICPPTTPLRQCAAIGGQRSFSPG